MTAPPDDTDGDVALEVSDESSPDAVGSGPALPATGRARPRIVAFGSGRAAPGQSRLAANVAVYLAQAGKKVVALDADPACGPLHQLLGAARPPRGFGEFLRGKAASLGELIVDTPVAGVGLIGGEGSAFGTGRAKQTAKATLAAI